MENSIKNSLLSWISGILDVSVCTKDVQTGKALIQLVNLTGDANLVHPDLTSTASIEQFRSFLDCTFQFQASSLFDIEAVVSGSATEEEIFGMCMLVLISCLHSRSRQYFMNAALDLDFGVQSVIFHLVREPMTQLSADQHITRDSILAGFREPVAIPQSPVKHAEDIPKDMMQPSKLTISEAATLEVTPIKSVSVDRELRQSWCSSNDDKVPSSDHNADTEALRRSWTSVSHATSQQSMVDVFSSSALHQQKDKTTDRADSPTFRAPEPVRPRRRKRGKSATSNANPTSEASHPLSVSQDVCSDSPSEEDVTGEYLRGTSSGSVYPLSISTLPPPQPPAPSEDMVEHSSNIKHRRPTELRLMLSNQMSNYNHQSSRNISVSNSMVDINDIMSAQKSHLQPPASPLASLKHLLDSPLWTQKTRLREAEREKRRLMADLEKERTYRDEVENVVAELRSQLDDARVRATEAESRATRLSRDLAALQDQTDELNLCRTELAVREDEITSLKQRLNSFQDLMAHSRKLELENANLQQECADHKQKVEQLSSKLSEIKDRRMVCTEVETLRSKLHDVEAQLFQQLLERETAEKDARRHHELYSQLKLQQTVLEKRRARNAHHSSTGGDAKHISSQTRLNGLHSGDEIECEDSTLGLGGSKDSVVSVGSKTKPDSAPTLGGENLGSVLESELRVAQSEASRLKTELQKALHKLHVREQEVDQLTERVQQLTVDLTASSTQCELSEQSVEQVRSMLDLLQTDLATLEGRLSWSRTVNKKCLDEMHQSTGVDVVTQLQTSGLLERLKGIGSGLSDKVEHLCHMFTANLDDLWTLTVGQLTTLQTTLGELRSTAECAKVALTQKEEELARTTDSLHEQAKLHAQQLASEKSELAASKARLLDLEGRHTVDCQTISDLEKRLELLLVEKQRLLAEADELKAQASREIHASKEMLEHATNRLQELEARLELQKEQKTKVEVSTQTDAALDELPTYGDDAPLSESTGDSVADTAQVGDENDLSPAGARPHPACEALASDRRGLSDELVRLHDELAESNLDRHELKQQVMELQDELISKEMDLQRLAALYSRAQEQWVLTEREALDAKNQLTQLHEEYASELRAMRAEVLPQISRSRSEAFTTASQIEAVRLKFEAERKDLKNKLAKATVEVERLEADRNRLVELNSSLKREMSTMRHLSGTVADRSLVLRDRQQVGKALMEALHSQHAPHNGSLEEWLESVTVNTSGPRASRHCGRDKTEAFRDDDGANGAKLSDSLSELSSHAYEDASVSVVDSHLGPLTQRNMPLDYDHITDGSSVNELSRSKSGVYSRMRKRHRHRSDRSNPKGASDEIAREVARLSSRTAALTTLALHLQQNMSEPFSWDDDEHLQQKQPQYPIMDLQSFVPHSASLAVPTAQGLTTGQENPASAPVQFPAELPGPSNHQRHELDTDADSSAFTDLSQVSSASQNGHRNRNVGSSLPQRHSPPYSAELSQMSVPHRSDSAYSSRQTRTTQPPQSISVPTSGTQPRHELANGKPQVTRASPVESDPHRITELHRRNRLQPMHLRTSYPVETQTVKPEQIASALRQLSSNIQRKEDATGFRKSSASVPLTAVPEDYGNVLREMDDGNVIDDQRLSDPASARLRDCDKPSLQSDRSERSNTRASPNAAGYRPIPRSLNHITDALIAASDDPSVMASALEAQLARAARIAPPSNSVPSSASTDSRQSQPPVSTQSAQEPAYSKKKNNSLAFEILMEPPSGKPRRLPTSRLTSSTIVRRVPGSKNSTVRPASATTSCNRYGSGPFSAAKLHLASTTATSPPNDSHCQTAPNSLHHNPKCLNPQSNECR